MSKNSIYKDFDLNFTPHPINGDVSVFTDAESAKRSIIQLLQIKKFEKPFHPEINSGINDLLFDIVTPLTIETLRTKIQQTIEKYEKRATVLELVVRPNLDGNAVFISMTAQIVNIQAPISFTVKLVRNR